MVLDECYTNPANNHSFCNINKSILIILHEQFFQRGCSSQAKKRLYSSPTSSQSHSFKYSKGPSVDEPEPDLTPRRVEHIPTFVVEGSEQVPLMHTVSFYRRQQNMVSVVFIFEIITVNGSKVPYLRVYKPRLDF
jgi:hypothetical protein